MWDLISGKTLLLEDEILNLQKNKYKKKQNTSNVA